MAYSIRFTEKGRRLLRGSDFDNSPEEMKRYYFDVRNTRESLGVAMSIFQSKDAPEIGSRFQYKVILKNEEEAAQRPISFLGFWF